MSNTNLTKAGPSTLNMEDIADYLRYEENFIDCDENRNIEIKSINGNTPCDRIALSVSPADRTTVDNALHLNGKGEEAFMSRTEGGGLSQNISRTRQSYNADIADLRDELYQLKYTLAKQGFIVNNNEYLGYHDVFRNGYKPYCHQVLGEVAAAGMDNRHLVVTQDTYQAVDNGDFIALYFKDVTKVNVRQIQKKLKDGETLLLAESVDSDCIIHPDNTVLYKSYGVSRDGNYYMANDAQYILGSTDRYSCLDDDSNFRSRKGIYEPEKGYATSFRIPEAKLGFLTKFEVQAKAYGMPSLACYIIDSEDLPNFKNPEQAEAMYLKYKEDKSAPRFRFFAKSAPVMLDPALAETVVAFDFFNAAVNSYPILDRFDDSSHAVRYVAIIEGLHIDKSNYVELLFLQHDNGDGTFGDLQLNNQTYLFERQKDTASSAALATGEELNQYDLYYGVTTREVILNDLEPIERGLYTARIKASDPKGISRARLTMRVGREGGRCFADISEPDVYGVPVNTSFTAGNMDSMAKAQSLSLNSAIFNPLEYRTDSDLLNSSFDDEPVFDLALKKTTETVIGNQILFAQESNYDQIYPETPVYVEPGDFIYRNAFLVSVKGKRWAFDEKKQCYAVREQKKIYLPLRAVAKDVVKHNKDIYSDRLIFEAEFVDDENNALFFNDMELQVYWENSSIHSFTQEEKKLKMGIIHDLVLSFDRYI